jgi:hypothetical protein
MEIRESPVAARTASTPTDPAAPSQGTRDGNIGPVDAGLSVASRMLAQLFETRGEDLDLAIMKVIAEGGSPSEWIAGMLRQVEATASPPPEPPRPRFLGE